MTIYCYGDSNTFGYDPRGYLGGRYDAPWPELLAELTGWEVRNNGSCGRRVPVRETVLPKNADLYLVMLGTNDLLQGEEPSAIAGNMERFLSGLDRARTVLIAPPPLCRGEWVPDEALVLRSEGLAGEYRTVARRLGIRFLDAGEWGIPLCYDGVHFREEGHRQFAQQLARTLRVLDCISVENMRESDAYTIAHFVPSLELMGRAAWGVYKAGRWQGRTAIVCGSGNNGGDGFALAEILQTSGFDCAVFTLSDRLSADSAHYADRARAAGVPIAPFSPGCLAGFDTVVDCLLGTGFRGSVRENYRAAIEAINGSGAFVVSVDINSGMDGDTGAGEWVVSSDLTVTIGFVKRGLVAPNAGKHMKRLVCTDIGIYLLREEDKLEEGSCPPWLDLTVIPALELRT